MLYTKIQPQSYLGSEDFKVYLPYMGMTAILFNSMEPFEQIVNTLLTEGPMWNLMRTQSVSEKKRCKNYTILYMYIVQGQGHITYILNFSHQSL